MTTSSMFLHWSPDQERHGLGKLVHSVNHVALIVSDVGRSTAFYTDVIGFQQIKRPNFDRHGAWLTGGNIEIHLIKGVPLVHSGENLIVSHISVDVTDAHEAFRRLRQMGVPYEINVSVPKGEGKAESEGGSADNTLSQAFLRDPDGYYLEICNCHLLTNFCLSKGNPTDQHAHLDGYHEGVHHPPKSFALWTAKLLTRAKRAKSKTYMAKTKTKLVPLPPSEQPEEADPVILKNFKKRQAIYGDICQSYTAVELEQILREAGNSAPKAIALMESHIKNNSKRRLFLPPSYYVETSTKEAKFAPSKFEAVDSDGTDTAGIRSLHEGEHKMGDFKAISVAEHGEGGHEFHLHWNDSVERRGLGDLVVSINHIALIVSDVGKSLAFYTEVLGLQQIKRPNFDRHGAWLTAGNVEIHLIKGNPLVHTGENLIVSHIALDVEDPELAFRRLTEMQVPFEVNVSVPKGAGKAESEGGSNDNTLKQAFLRDPDGYYYEVCNCNLLTDFVLGGSAMSEETLTSYEEGGRTPSTAVMTDAIKLLTWAKRAKKVVKKISSHETDVQPLSDDDMPNVDDKKLENLKRRRAVYGDICQSFNHEQLETILRQAGNDVPTCLLLMNQRIMNGHKRVFLPPGYYVHGTSGAIKKFSPSQFEAPPSPPSPRSTATAGLKILQLAE